MTGEKDLSILLGSMQPELAKEEYVFVTLANQHYGDHIELAPIASFQEQEGLTLVIKKETALQAGFDVSDIYRRITLQIHSSLQAVGLTAAVSTQLAQHGISANVIAAFYHDHIFVPAEKAEDAIKALSVLSLIAKER